MWAEVKHLQIKMPLKHFIGTLLKKIYVVSISKCTKVVAGESNFDFAMKTMLQQIHVDYNT